MYMTQRLVRMRTVLAPTGSIYLHCDPTASHYLKVIMDGVFRRSNFRNEVIWKRTSAHSDAGTMGSVHDVLLFYTRSEDFTFNVQYRPYDPDYVESHYTHEDSRGRFMDGDITAKGLAGGGYPYEYKGKDSIWRVPREKMAELDADDRLYFTRTGGIRIKRYLHEMKGMPVSDLWSDISPINSQAKERLGFPTQKPQALLERIIQQSSREGDLVLDPYCGCGTSIVAAHRLKRRWIGIDISGNAIDEIDQSLSRIGVNADYEMHEGQPDTMAEYNRMNAFEKQDWLIRRVDGLPNPRKSGDRGVDGDMTIHLGVDGAGQDQWGRVVFSVKTGKQRKPEHVRELIGTMKNERADIAVLILDVEPTEQMEEAAQRAKQLSYQQRADMPPKEYDRVQILTAYEIIEGAKVDCPPTLQVVRRFREAQMEMRV